MLLAEVKQLNKYLPIILTLSLVICIESAYIIKMVPIIYFPPTIVPDRLMIWIQDVKNDSGMLKVEVQNVGPTTVTIETLYVNGVNQTFSSSPSLKLLPSNETWLTTIFPSGYATVKINVVCTDGIHEQEVAQTFPYSPGSP